MVALPRSTYRLQFRDGMTFDRAAEAVPYIARLGISHLYASPIFSATQGSTHGYDVIDHNAFDPSLGGAAGFERLTAALAQAGMGLILDIVPNHMAASLENAWWRNVVEWGKQSPFAHHFDIDWSRRLTLAMLDRPYDDALDEGRLAFEIDADQGVLTLAFNGVRAPLHPRSYAAVFGPLSDPLATAIAQAGSDAEPEMAADLHDRIRAICASGDVGRLNRALAPLSQDRALIDRVHEAQPWRLLYWRLDRTELNYRRFFEVSGLVGVRVERKEVFDDVHRLILDLVRSRKVQGLRVDHVDGLADPAAYLDQLRAHVGSDVPIFVEKILEGNEVLPPNWPVTGTTGYEFIAMMADVLVDAEKVETLERAYGEAIGQPADLKAEERSAKALMVHRNFEVEVSALLTMATNLAAETDAAATPASAALRDAIAAFLMAFPVYRTYGNEAGLSDHDRALLLQVRRDVDDAAREPAERSALDFVLRLLAGDVPSAERVRAARFRTRFQQLSGPVMAKALEDTLFYRHNSLIALNEVGGSPGEVVGSVEHFHRRMADRVKRQPHGLSATATHDTKRGEDARARLYAISEAPGIWAEAVRRWRAMHAGKVSALADGPAPEPATEWLLYQALAGVWPDDPEPDDRAAFDHLGDRFRGYVEKALREAKTRTGWTAVNETYEKAVLAYASWLVAPQNKSFLADFDATLRPFRNAGVLNSLAQTLIKMTAPGISDIYQGCEGWDLSLVDPDNRRPVDFVALSRTLDSGDARQAPRLGASNAAAKQHMIARCLRLRSDHPALFGEGAYIPLTVAGERARHVIAFARRHGDETAITVAPRLTFGLLENAARDGRGLDWRDTRILLPQDVAAQDLNDILGGRTLAAGPHLEIGSVLGDLPVALLVPTGMSSVTKNAQRSPSDPNL